MKRLLFLVLALLLLPGCVRGPQSAFSGQQAETAPPVQYTPSAPDTSPAAQEDLRFYRSRLSERAQGYYDGIFEALGDFSAYGVTGDGAALLDFQRALTAVQYDFPETRMYTALDLEGEKAAIRYVFAWAPEEPFEPERMGEILKETEKLAALLLSGLEADAAAKEKYLYIAQAMAAAMEYDHEHVPVSSYLYGALKNGLCICEGYADTYTYLCHMAGLWCISVDGVANGVHAWNMVELEGKRYHVDVTWGDTGQAYMERYFLLTEAEIARDHTRYSLYDSPEAALAAGALRDPSYNSDILAE